MGVLPNVSQRFVCWALGWCRASMRHIPKPRPRDERMKTILPVLARAFPREGYRFMRERVSETVEHISRKALRRLWRLLNLQVKPRKRHRTRRKALPVLVGLRATGPNDVWCLDFMKDWTFGGRALRLLSVVDEYTRECLALISARSFTAADVIAVLEWLCWRHGKPVHVRSDNGPEFVAKIVERWAEQVGVHLVRSEPGSPWQNPYSETFHSRARDEFTEATVFGSLAESIVLCESYREWYNLERRHSSLKYQTPAAFAKKVRKMGLVLGEPGLAMAQA